MPCGLSTIPRSPRCGSGNAEFEAAGRKVALGTLQRLRLGYERQGLRALIDGRAIRGVSVSGRAGRTR